MSCAHNYEEDEDGTSQPIELELTCETSPEDAGLPGRCELMFEVEGNSKDDPCALILVSNKNVPTK